MSETSPRLNDLVRPLYLLQVNNTCKGDQECRSAQRGKPLEMLYPGPVKMQSIQCFQIVHWIFTTPQLYFLFCCVFSKRLQHCPPRRDTPLWQNIISTNDDNSQQLVDIFSPHCSYYSQSPTRRYHRKSSHRPYNIRESPQRYRRTASLDDFAKPDKCESLKGYAGSLLSKLVRTGRRS